MGPEFKSFFRLQKIVEFTKEEFLHVLLIGRFEPKLWISKKGNFGKKWKF